MTDVRITIFATADEADIAECGDLEAALRARLSEVFTDNGPISLRVLGADVEED